MSTCPIGQGALIAAVSAVTVLLLVKYNNKSSIIVVENAKKSKWHVKTVYCNLRDEYNFLFKIFIIILI